jgi:alkylated DNA nucleotide flippase Atl1
MAGVEGVPQKVDPTSFQALGALELQHVEKWIATAPDVLGERLLVISKQFAKFDKAKDRLDILALDESGRLVVVELKREADASHDLQGIRYAAYCAGFGLEDVTDLYVEHRGKQGAPITREAAREELARHVIDGDVEQLDEDLKPRIILVSKSFRVEVTSTCLWLREQYEMEISCIQLVPYQVEGEILLASSVLIPLPEAAAYTVQRDRKLRKATSKKVNWDVLRQVMAAIPAGHWMSYQDLAVAAGGTPGAGMAVGQYLARSEDYPEGVHRVLRANGSISPAWEGVIGGPDDCRALLESEGLTFDDSGRADPARRWQPTITH